jgi:hypothetical protein
VTKIITVHLTLANLFFLLVIPLIFAQSCVLGPLPVRYYKPLNEGKRIGDAGIKGADYILLLDIDNGVIARTGLYSTSVPQNFLLVSVVMIVPREQSVRLASDKVEVHSPELDSPITGRVTSIKEMEGHRYDYYEYEGLVTLESSYSRLEVPPLGPYDELYGYKVKGPSFYLLIIEFINKNPVPEEPPENVTVFLPEMYINDELHKIEPLRFKSTWTVIFYQ